MDGLEPLMQTELLQLFKDIQQLTRIQLQREDQYDELLLGGIGPGPIAAHLTIHAYDNEPGSLAEKGYLDTEIGIQVEYIYTPKGHTSLNPTRETQYASFAYTGADTDQPFAINWDQQPGK